MDNKLNREKIELKIKPKREQYFKNKLLFIKTSKITKYPLNTIEKNLKNKYKYLIKQKHEDKSIQNHNNVSLDYDKFNNKLLREAISLNIYKNKNKLLSSAEQKRDKIKRRLKLLEKDIDIYSPEYKRLFSAQILDTKTKFFNQNKTYDRIIKYNLKKFLFSETKEYKINNKKSSILDKKSIKINKLTDNIYNDLNEKSEIKHKNNKKNRPTSTIMKYSISPHYNKKYRIKDLFDRPDEKNKKKNNKLIVNIINISLELNGLSNKYQQKINNLNNFAKQNKDIFNEKIKINDYSISERNSIFNKKAKEFIKKRKKNISFNNNEKLDKNKMYIIKYIQN